MSTEARRASLPPRPPHAPRTAGNPGPFDPRTPLDDTASPQADRPASDDTGAADTDRAEARRPGPGSSGARDAGTATGDSTTTPRASADAPCADAARPERPHRPSGTDDGTSTIGPQRPVPDGTPRSAAPAEPTHRPTQPATSDARRTDAVPAEPTYRPGTGGVDSAERSYRAVGEGPTGRAVTSAESAARRTGAAPAEPTYRPGTGGADSAERPYRPVGEGPTGRAATPTGSDVLGTGTAERPYRPVGEGPTGRAVTSAESAARRTGAVPAEPTYRPGTGGVDSAERSYRQVGEGRTGRAATPTGADVRRTDAVPAEPTYRPGTGGADSAERPYPPVGDGTPAPGDTPQRPAPGARPRFPRIGADGPDRAAPPPQASARFPDAPPTVGRGVSAPPGVGQRVSQTPPAPSAPPRPAHRPRTETPSETTTRLRPVPAQPDPALSWSAPMSPGGVPGAGRPASVSFGEPERWPRPFARRTRGQVVAAALCLVLGTGLIGGAVTGAWLADGPEGPGTRHAFAVAGDLWHEVPVDQLFPPTVQGRGAGPGEADRVWTRIAVAPDSGCKGAFDALLTRALAPVGCERLLRATYTDATQSHVTTVGLLFTEADAAGMEALARRFERERLDRRGDLMPLPYAAEDTAAEGFGPGQRASWAISVLTDAPVVVYAVSGWADGRTVDEPQPAEDAMRSGATTAPAQAGLGHEARGLADRFERTLRQRAGTPTERPS
ncbi:hypothetical protein GCM10022285_47790 [Streptomyces tunisiensis]|uniref:Uncharacterized protein n=2 Tax=Streptomyces tunisiensis TaxID=948699 RepID=A0ABP7Z0A0_9ACTN